MDRINDNTLVQYLFVDGHEEIANLKRKIVAVRNPSIDKDYHFFKTIFKPKVRGSAPDSYSYDNFSNIPKEQEYLVTFKFPRGSYISRSPIKSIDINFQFPSK